MRTERNEAIALRRAGKTYGEIQRILGIRIPKSTLYNWARSIRLSPAQKNRIARRQRIVIARAQKLAHAVLKKKREEKMIGIERSIQPLFLHVKNKSVAKLILAALYLAEGGHFQRSSLMFGNSDPNIIALFLNLMRSSYPINESKFRCTVQCRADQDIPVLERFWSRLTHIHRKQFYKARIDPRSKNQPSRKLDYKGVCRIDYFSADIYNELILIGRGIIDAVLGR